jgi:uncharacterized protein (TIGR03435 family)
MTNADPGIEVATIKRTNPDTVNRGYGIAPGRITSMNTSVANIITFAYDLHERQISGGPDWLRSDKYDITARPDSPGQPNLDQAKLLFRKLLADRFHLAFRREQREMPVYAITQIPGTPLKMAPSADSSGSMMFSRLGHLPAHGASMSEFARVMQRAVLDRPVVDQTHLTGHYDFTLNWTPDQFQFANFAAIPAQDDAAAPNLFEAFRQQLGLKLEATRAAAELLIVDGIERPTEN